MIALLLAPALAADATGLRLDTPSPASGLAVPALSGTPGDLDAAVIGGLLGESAVAYYDDGSREVLLDGVTVLDVAFAFVPARNWRVEAGLPVVAGASIGDDTGGIGGDLWVAASYLALRAGPVELGPRLRVAVPVSPWGPLTTEGGVSAEASAVAHARLAGLALGARAGVFLRSESDLASSGNLAREMTGGTFIPLGLSASHRLAGPLRAGLDLGAKLAMPSNSTLNIIGPTVEYPGTGAELLAHLALDLRRVELLGGYGVGLGDGLGVPTTHGFLGVRGKILSGEVAPADIDADGVVDTEDRCRDTPEDKDGFHDSDGCPDTDDDRDGIADASDKCPRDPEDIDAFEDQDGCVEPDNDKDGINDGADDCPLAPGPAANRGCPPAPGRVRVTAARIEIDDRVYFDTGRATIQEVSFPLLREVAAAINAAPDIAGVQVAGHTDSEGDDAANLALSQARADAVRLFLVTYGGVDPSRLEARGFGETMPVASNQTEEGRAQNRRVEFVIVRRR